MEIKFSKYASRFSKQKIDIDADDYCDMIINGYAQDTVLPARAVKNLDLEKYKAIKDTAPCITGSAIMNQGSKVVDNIKELNGLIVLDIDQEVDIKLLHQINNDRYTFISHRSFGGDGVCVFVKINPNKFLESFNDLAQYYWDNFDLVIDPACKNKNRLRYISYDPYLFRNDSSKKFIAKSRPKKEVKHDFVFVKDDFDNILEQIKEQSIDLCQDDYDRYVRIGFAIASQYGASGFGHFDFICSYGSKYDPKNIEKHYNNFVKTNTGKVTISTIYYYAKEMGLNLYSEKTAATIKRVAVAKSQGTPTVDSIKQSLSKINKIDDPDEGLIKSLLDAKSTIKPIEEDESETKQLQAFISENYTPYRDGVTSEIFVNDVLLDDAKLNTIYFAAKNYLEKQPTKSDVRDMINSLHTPTTDPVKVFLSNNTTTETGYIDQYIDCIQPVSEYNKWAFKKWVVGALHNWISDINETKVCPLTLVLCGQKQGTGKTSFFRNLLPKELKKYLIEHKIDIKEKDSIYNMVKGLIILDDEFGGLASKDVKDFKKVADTNMIDIRLPYSAYYSKMKRKASLCGTSNEVDILKDVTGNRRILPVNVQAVDYERMIKIDTDKLWAEAFTLYQEGFDWKIYNQEDIEYLEANTTENIESMPVEELFFKFFSLEQTETHTRREIMNKGEILNHLNTHTKVQISKYDINNIFVKNKLQYKAHRNLSTVKKGIELYMESDFPASGIVHEAPF